MHFYRAVKKTALYLGLKNKEYREQIFGASLPFESMQSTDIPLELEKLLSLDSDCRKRTSLIRACVVGNVEEIKAVLENSKDIHTLLHSKDLRGSTALHVAARFSQLDAARILVQYGVDVNVVSNKLATPLYIACRYANEELIKLLLIHGADPRLILHEEGSLLHIIAQCGTTSIADMVFTGKYHPPVKTVDDLGMTALHYAAQIGNAKMCTWLLNHGSDLRARDSRMATPFMVASRQGHVEVMKTLFLSYGLDVKEKSRILADVDDEGMGALHYAVMENRYLAAQMLLQWGADPNIFSLTSMSPLHICAVNGKAEMVPLLINHKADPNLRDSSGRTPLHSAVHYMKPDVIASLIKRGADLNTEDCSYNTPFLDACEIGSTDVVEILTSLEVDASKTNFYSQTCFHIVAERGHLSVLVMLLELYGDNLQLLEAVDIFHQSALHMAARQNDSQFVERFLQRGCSPDVRDAAGRLPLHVAARGSSYETVLKLAEVTSNVNGECSFSKTAFFTACEHGNREAISALKIKGGDYHDTDVNFRNTLMVAAIGGYTDIAVDLINLGVQISSKDKERNTALHHACMNGHLSTVKALLAHGASVSATNVHGESPLDLAVAKSESEVAVYMMEHRSWEESLSVKDRKGLSCMHRMVINTPAAVKTVLDKCIRRSDHAPSDPAFAIEFNYKYIDPSPEHRGSSHLNDDVLVTMLDHDREELLSHPLCQSNLSYKWYTYGKTVFAFTTLLQVTVLVLMTIYIFIMPRPHSNSYRCNMQPKIIDNGTNGTTNTGRDTLRSSQFLLTTLSIALVTYGTLPPGREPCDDQWRALVYGTVIFYIMVSLTMRRFGRVGIYFTMFFEVTKTMAKTSCMMAFFILAFTIPFTVMLAEDGFKDGKPTILTTFAMTIGELYYRDNFVMGDNSPFTIDLYCLFPTFCIVMNVALMNLLIGVAVGDISKVERKANLRRIRTRVNFLLETEKSTLPLLKRTFYNEKLVVRPNSKPRSWLDKIKRTVLYAEQISLVSNNHDTSANMTETEKELRQELQDQNIRLHKLTETANDLKTILEKMSESSTGLSRRYSDVHVESRRGSRILPMMVEEATLDLGGKQ